VRVSIPESWSDSPYVAAGGISFGVGLLLALLGIPILHFAAIVLLVVFTPVALALAVICAAIAADENRAKRAGRAFLMTLGVLLCLGLAQVPGIAAGFAIHQMHVSRAKSWCEELSANLETWRESHGAYPASLAETPFVVDPPRLCDLSWLYRRNEDGTYTMYFYTGQGLDSAWRFSSNERIWIHSS